MGALTPVDFSPYFGGQSYESVTEIIFSYCDPYQCGAIAEANKDSAIDTVKRTGIIAKVIFFKYPEYGLNSLCWDVSNEWGVEWERSTLLRDKCFLLFFRTKILPKCTQERFERMLISATLTKNIPLLTLLTTSKLSICSKPFPSQRLLYQLATGSLPSMHITIAFTPPSKLPTIYHSATPNTSNPVEGYHVEGGYEYRISHLGQREAISIRKTDCVDAETSRLLLFNLTLR